MMRGRKWKERTRSYESERKGFGVCHVMNHCTLSLSYPHQAARGGKQFPPYGKTSNASKHPTLTLLFLVYPVHRFRCIDLQLIVPGLPGPNREGGGAGGRGSGACHPDANSAWPFG